jgi:hypothetical protein
MYLSNIEFGMASLLQACRANPSMLIAVLATACAITFIIAILTDNMVLSRKGNQARKASERRGFSELHSQAASDSN